MKFGTLRAPQRSSSRVDQLLKLVILLTLPRNLLILYCFGGFMGVEKDVVDAVDGLSAALIKCPIPVTASSTPCSSPLADVSTSK